MGAEPGTRQGVPASFALAHEYGHNIARSRLNPPFSGGALTWGTKRWASTQRICTLASERKLFPGNTNHYWDDPGEAMAEEYATTQTTSGSAWEYTPLDGSLRVRLTGPSRADFDLMLYSAHGNLIRISRKRRSRESVGFTVCRQRRMIARVASYRGAGQAHLMVSRP